MDEGSDGVFTAEEIQGITEIYIKKDTDVEKSEKISDLTGIEYFTALTYLNCGNNNLASLDVSKNTALVALDCRDNQLTRLDISKNIALEGLCCTDNQLVSLDVSHNMDLTDLKCSENQLTSLGVNKNTKLTNLDCDINQLTGLDVSENTALRFLDCDFNQLTSLDVTKNVELIELKCSDNYQLTSLDASGCTALTELYCYSNQLTSLDVSEDIALTLLRCEDNQLESLDVSEDIALSELRCYQNQLTSLDVSKNTALKFLSCGDNQLTNLEVSGDIALSELMCGYNKLTSLDVSKNTDLSSLVCYDNKLTNLDVSKNTGLLSLVCYNNQLTSLNVSKNIELVGLNCGDNQLASLDVSKNTALINLHCDNNQLTSLDVSKNVALTTLDFENNQLTSLDVSKNIELDELNYDNNIYTINISDHIFDLSKLPGSFDVSKASSWSGGSVSNGILTVDDGEESVMYKYDCGHNKTATFFLHVSDEVGQHTHSAILHTGKAATCGAAGEKDYYTCTCGKAFEDEACTKEITDLDNWKVIPATGKHTLKTSTTKATLKKDGSIKTACSVCGKVTEEKTISRPAAIKLAKTSFIYDGKAKTPSVNVTDANGKAIASGNYDLAYASGRKNVGAYTVKVTFKGNYSGTKTLSFAINPKGTSLSKIKAGKKKLTVKWKKQASQTTGYQIQYSLKKNFKSAKTLTVNKNKTISKAITKLKAKKKYFVRIRTYKTVNGKKYCSSWSKVKSATTKK